MNIVIDNIWWMAWNTSLALMGAFFAYVFATSKRPTTKSVFGLLCLLFMPNTIYMLTDWIHIPGQWLVSDWMQRGLLLIQYAGLTTLAVVTYLKSMQWLEQGAWRLMGRNERRRMWLRRNMAMVIVGVNFLTAFAVVMGRVLRTNSWYVFTEPLRVLYDATAILSNQHLLVLVLMFGVSFNFLYFGLRQALPQPLQE